VRFANRITVPFLVLSATALVVVTLVLVGLLAERRPAVAEPSATPPLNSASPRTAAPAPTPPAARVLSDRFGFVWAEQRGSSGVNVRPETGQGGFELPSQHGRFSQCGCAASPDGARIAYWAGSTPGAIELRVVDVARAGLGTAIYKPPADQQSAALAWSNDGSGILFSLEGWPTPGGPVGPVTNTALLVIDATGGVARTLATEDGAYVPLAWDRASGVAAAGVSGDGGYLTAYLIAHTSGDPAPQRTAMPESILMGSVRVSTDQRYVLGMFLTGQAGSTLRWWRLADPGVMFTGPKLEVQPAWRPLSNQIGWVVNGTLQLMDVERGVTSSTALPPGNYLTLAFRVDGSAVATTSGLSLLNPSSYALVDIASGRSAAFTQPGSIAGSVRFTAGASVTQPLNPYTPPPLNTREVRVINALAKLGITGNRAQLPYDEANVWADFGNGRHFFVNAYPLGVVDRNYTVLDERQVGGTRIQHVQRPSGTISSRFECSGDEYWVNGADPPGFQNIDVFVERFISVLSCSA
jgi:hypothetical protein